MSKLPEIIVPPKVNGNSPDFTNKSDVTLVNRAMKDRWPVTDEHRIKAMSQISKVLDTSEDDKLKMMAVRTLLLADQLNLKEEELEIKKRPKMHIHADMSRDELVGRLTEVASRMGLDISKVSNPIAAIKGMIEAKLNGK